MTASPGCQPLQRASRGRSPARLLAWVASGAAWCGYPASVAHAQREPYPVDSARIEVRVHAESSEVRVRYWFARPVRALDFTHLTNACTRVVVGTARRGERSVTLVVDSNPPWVVLHDTTDAASEPERGFTYDVEYRVHYPGGSRLALPVIQPAGAIDARGAPVRPKVQLVVRNAGLPGLEPRLPRFSATGPGEWHAGMAAVPATVVMRSGSAVGRGAPCDDAIGIPGENGGFVRHVLLFAGTIALWIPLYFGWALRRRPGERVDAT